MNAGADEYELARQARSGDREALAELVARTRLRLFALAYAELRHYDDAHDAVAAALLQICLHVHELREPERVRAWMQSIVRNEARLLRRRRDLTTLSLAEADGSTEGEEPSLLRLDIDRALRRLPGDQARAIRLFYLAELSVGEVARRLGRSEGTVKSWLHRGRRHLAQEMEGYSEVTSLQSAAIVHSDLEPELIRALTEALKAAGYAAKVITPKDLSELPEALKACPFVVLDERIQGRPALELLIHLRADPNLSEIAVCLLSSYPSDFTASAYFSAGLDRMVRKDDPDDIARLARHVKPTASTWRPFTERARRAVVFAKEEARRLGESYVGTEHLLLGMLREDNLGAGVLARLGVSGERIRSEIEEKAIRGPGHASPDTELTPRAQRVISLAYAEALAQNNNYIGCEHLLLGLLREGDGLAGKVLTDLGVDVDSARQQIPVVGAPWFDVLEAERRLQEAKAAYHAFLTGT
jgi:RNA polymerase sigma factor (sigma-70 family)